MTQKFHDRFKVDVSLDEAKRRFVNRVNNEILTTFLFSVHDSERHKVEQTVLTILGIRWDYYKSLLDHVGDDFYTNVQAVEALYKAVSPIGYGKRLSELITGMLWLSEVDLGIRWHNGEFLPSGSPLLDEKLVNDVLGGLRDPQYAGVKDAFVKGLHHFLQSIGKPQFLSDAVTNMYEAMEALAKIITRRDKDLSTNLEPFLAAVKVSNSYKPIMKEYIAYGNKIRHAGKDGQPKPNLSRKEVESFVYMTGVFVRLAVLEESQA
jgi:hypothetical protein